MYIFMLKNMEEKKFIERLIKLGKGANQQANDKMYLLKGQKKPKADCCAVDSPQKTNK